MAEQQKKIIVITNIPNSYRIPLFNELNRQMEEKGLKLKVLFGSAGYARRKSEIDLNDCLFDYEILDSEKFHFGNTEKTYFSYKGVFGAIRREGPDAIIVSGFSIVTIRLWLGSFFRKTNYMIWSGSIEKKGRHDSWTRMTLRKLLVKRASAFISYGSKAGEYLQKLGARGNKIFTAVNTVDTEFYFTRTKSVKNSLKKTGNQKHLTYVGYLTPRKKVIQLLESIRKLAEVRQDFVLDLIGDGEDRMILEKFVNDNGLAERVRFHGFVQKEQLPDYFGRSNCFLFQTGFDIWGLVLNEAMAAGLPCVSSENAGATFDLIRDGETGFKMDFNKTDEVVNKINWILDHETEAGRIGEQASRFIRENASLEISAQGFIKAIEATLNG
jgi:glycosyltransferase involved in cell wall biosynthesis